MSELPCPTCGSQLTFLDQYRRHYCHRCQRYAPEGYGDHGVRHCPNCGGILSYVAQYDRFYCYRCNAYAPGEVAEFRKADTPSTRDAESTGLGPAVEATPTAAAAAPPTEAKPADTIPATPASKLEATPSAASSGPVAQAATPKETEPLAHEGATAIPAMTTPEAPALPETKADSARPFSPYAGMKPAALRVKVFSLKKAELMDLCKVYELDPTGTKEQIQERILSYLHDLETEEEETPSETQPAPESAGVASTVAETPEPEEPTSAPREVIEPPASDAAREPVEIVQAKIPKVSPAASTVTLEEPRPATHVDETRTEPYVVSVPAEPTVGPSSQTPVQPTVTHPCPRCGSELAYIRQYARWYCYSCQRYAPEARAAKFACPSCGASLRWISQYERWWCDSCEKYAPADLPRPRRAVSASAHGTAVAARSETASQAVVATHRHGSPSGGVSLIVFGILLFVMNAVLFTLPPLLNYRSPIAIAPAEATLLEFAAFLLVAVGAVVGLAAIRHRD